MTAPALPYHVVLQDELPTIGSGHRWVFAREGHKWVFVLCPYTLTTARIPLARWRGIKRRPGPERPWYLAQVLKDNLTHADREPTAFELSALGAGS